MPPKQLRPQSAFAQVTTEEQARLNGVNMKIEGSSRIVPVVFQNIQTGQQTSLTNNLLTLSVEFSMNGASALTMEIVDPGFEMAAKNYFQVGQTIMYKSQNISNLVVSAATGFNYSRAATFWNYPFELSSVDVSQTQGFSPVFKIQAFTKAIQQMKRDRKPSNIKGSGKLFVENAARKYGLQSVVQKTSKNQSITGASTDKQADSLWDVLTRLASESKDDKGNPFMCFEADGTLYFGSQSFLMHRWGVDSYIERVKTTKKINGVKKTVETLETRFCTKLTYPYKPEGQSKYFTVMNLPSIQKSDNDPLYGSGSLIVERANGVRLRPGMTIYVGEIPYLSGYYLIDTVSFSEMSPDPVAVNFVTPERQPKYIKEIAVGPILKPSPYTGTRMAPSGARGAGSQQVVV
jgi:hypothetical protein